MIRVVGVQSVIRNLVGILFGFNEDIATLEKRVKSLGWDPVFDVHTRSAFLELTEIQPRQRCTAVFLDFDSIHKKNELWGYEEVDRRIRSTLAFERRSGDLVGRWYSGDEIVMVLACMPHIAIAVLNRIREVASAHNLSFTHAHKEWHPGIDDIHETVRDLSQNVMERKVSRTMHEVSLGIRT